MSCKHWSSSRQMWKQMKITKVTNTTGIRKDLQNFTVQFQKCAALFLTVCCLSEFEATFGTIRQTVSCSAPCHTSRLSFSCRIFLDEKLHPPNRSKSCLHKYLIGITSEDFFPVINFNSIASKCNNQSCSFYLQLGTIYVLPKIL